MAGDIIFGDGVVQGSTTSGTGPLQLDIAPANGVKGFVQGIGDGNITAYKIAATNGDWEITWGTVTDSVMDTISRGTLIASNTGSRVNFDNSEKVVACVMLPEILLHVGQNPSLLQVDVASAATCDIGAVPSFFVNITGTTTITSFGTQKKCLRIVKFAGALTLTRNAASMILQNGANRTTAAGDVGWYISDASGYWRELVYFEATNSRAKSGANSDITSLSGLTTVLSVVQGGTGCTSLGALIVALNLGSAAFVSSSTFELAGVALLKVQNLNDLPDKPAARSTLGIKSMALRDVTIQNGGSPSGGADGDIWLIY